MEKFGLNLLQPDGITMRLPGTEGLSAILRNRHHRSSGRNGLTSESVLRPAPGIPNLFVMPAGPLDTEPSELIGSNAMQGLLQEWSTQFDHIIIDTSPVVLVSDAVRLSVSAHSVILLVRWGHPPREAFARAQELLTQVNATVMGVVFNGADLTSAGFSDYGKYGYYGSSQQADQARRN